MKPISRNLIFNYQPLSDIQLSKDEKKVWYVSSKADLKNNDYRQDLRVYDLESGKNEIVLKAQKRVPYFVCDDGILLIDVENKKEGYTKFDRLNGKKRVKAFELPLNVSSIQDFNRNFYLVSATINRNCPDYHELSVKDQKQYLKEKKKNEDYIVFDEYPFCYNGAGIINGNRNALFLVSKKTYKINRITPVTLDVENFDVQDEKILMSGVDFETFKGKLSAVYEYVHKDKKLSKLYDEKMEVYRLFYYKDKKVILGTYGKDWGAIESGKFYELKDNEMHLLIDCEYSFYNAVLSDVRYGKSKSLYKNKNGDVYLLTCAVNTTVIMKFTADKLETVFSENGTADDFCVNKDGVIYTIAMLDMKLQEVYEKKDDKLKALTSINKAVLSSRYVAKPEELILEKGMPVYGWVLKPIDYDPKKKYPAILDIHGGPRCAYGPIFMQEMQIWASEGYFVFFCNPRGSDGRGNAFGDLRRKYGTIDYEDIMDFTDLVLEKYPQIDKERLGVAGGSYGGYMTNWIVGHTDRFKAAASQRSISNWISEVTVSDYGIDFPIEMEFDDVRACEKELWDCSPLKYVNNVKTPILFIHSDEDYRCPLEQALQFYTPIRINGVDTKLVIFKGENHELSRNGKPTHRLRRLDEITDWLNKYLKRG